MTAWIDLRHMYSILSIKLCPTPCSKMCAVEHRSNQCGRMCWRQPLLRRDSSRQSGLNVLCWLKSVRNVFRKVCWILHVESEGFVSVHSLNIYSVEFQFEIVVEMIIVNHIIFRFFREPNIVFIAALVQNLLELIYFIQFEYKPKIICESHCSSPEWLYVVVFIVFEHLMSRVTVFESREQHVHF